MTKPISNRALRKIANDAEDANNADLVAIVNELLERRGPYSAKDEATLRAEVAEILCCDPVKTTAAVALVSLIAGGGDRYTRIADVMDLDTESGQNPRAVVAQAVAQLFSAESTAIRAARYKVQSLVDQCKESLGIVGHTFGRTVIQILQEAERNL